MSNAMGSKQAAAYLIDPLNQPEPSAETGLGSHFGSTFAPAKTTSPATPPRTSLASNNPFRDEAARSSPPSKGGVSASERPIGRGSGKQPISDHREIAFGGLDPPRQRAGSQSHGAAPPSYDTVTSGPNSPSGPSKGHHRRTSSLKERFPGDHSHQPLDVVRRESKKANRSPHLKKTQIPGADLVDRLDPAIGGRAYHHEGPYDAALLARNTDAKNSPLAALQTSNEEALKATSPENIKDAVQRHKPLDGVAAVPPGHMDRFGRTYEYEEGADLMHEDNPDGPGYKRWAGKDYDPEDLKGEAEPAFGLDRALQAHKIDDNGIEMEDRAHINKAYHDAKARGGLDTRDPVHIAGDDRKYADMEHANTTDADVKRTGSLRAAGSSLKKRIGSLRHRKDE